MILSHWNRQIKFILKGRLFWPCFSRRLWHQKPWSRELWQTRSLVFLLLLSWAVASQVAGSPVSRRSPKFYGKEWTGGGGLIENEFVMVWQQGDEWKQPCMVSQTVCGLSANEFQTLETLITEDHQWPLTFRSFQMDPSLNAHALGPERVVATGFRWEDPIYINLDVLYDQGSDPLRFRGVQRPIRHIYAALLWKRGLQLEDAFALSTKVALFWSHQQNIHHLGMIGHPELTVSYFLSEPLKLFLNDEQAMVDLTDWFQGRLRCDGQGPVRVLNLKNTYWADMAESIQEIFGRWAGVVTYSCGAGQTLNYRAEFELQLVFGRTSPSMDGFRWLPEHSQLNTFYREPLR